MDRTERNNLLISLSKTGMGYAEMGKAVSLSGARVRVILGELALSGAGVYSPMLTRYKMSVPTLAEYPQRAARPAPQDMQTAAIGAKVDAMGLTDPSIYLPLPRSTLRDDDPNSPDAQYFDSDEEAEEAERLEKENAQLCRNLGIGGN